MKIQYLTTYNFKGLEGQKTYDFSKNKMIGFCQENGSGKTSIINALQFVLAGTTTTEMIFRGADYAMVSVGTDSGNTYARKIFADSKRSVECYVNNKKVSARDMNAMISTETGVSVDNAKVATSGELLMSLNNQKLSDTLMGAFPEQMTVEDLLKKVPNATKTQLDIVKEITEKGLQGRQPDAEGKIHFGTNMVDFIYNELIERRKLLKKNISQLEGAVTYIESLGQPTCSKEEAEAALASGNEALAAANAYAAKKQAYDQTVALANNQKQQIAQLDAQIQRINVPQHTQEEHDSVAAARESVQATGNALYSAINMLKNTINSLNTAIARINEPVCPLSDKIKCTTDKRPYVADLQAQIDEANKAGNEQWAQYQAALQKYNELTAQLHQIETEMNAENQKQELIKQKQNLEANIIAIPEAPVPVESVQAVQARISEAQKNLTILNNQDKAKEAQKKVENWKVMLADYEFLVAAFSSKGSVKEAITAYYLDDLAESINEKSERLHKNMRVKFVNDKGIAYLIDPRGTGTYLPYTSLSGGEQACAMFLLLDLLSTISGFGVIILDELSVLDNQTFTALIELLKENLPDYGIVIVSAVSHSDTLETLKSHNVQIISC